MTLSLTSFMIFLLPIGGLCVALGAISEGVADVKGSAEVTKLLLRGAAAALAIGGVSTRLGLGTTIERPAAVAK